MAVFRMSRIGSLAVVALLAGFGVGFAQPADVEGLVFARQSNSRDIGGAYRELNAELKNGVPMKFLVEQYAGQMADLAKEQITWFPAGTGPDSGVKTAAKKEIWTEPDAFKKANDLFAAEAEKLRKVASSGDKVALAEQVKVTAQTCKGCHDKFKEKDEHDFQF
jgi:cytochrome c556